MARPTGNRPSQKNRTTRPPVPAMSGGAGAVTVDPPRKKVSVAQFFREVDAERKKITWTTRKETWITSVMVFIMVIVTSLFFFAADLIMSYGVNWILQFASRGN
jgi:preprotein translocase subunit SecE